MPREIILYSAQLCGDCQQLKAYMDAHGIRYEVRDIKESPEHARALETRTGRLGVPYLVIDGEWVRGYQPGKPFSESFARGLFGLA
ncbi:MAG: glutaredoxin family protein [Candidatus Hydrogenedentes bacterium]|nr:glutaredoxin family protein [Candidatus Hydrogenedentota bacterium]